MHRIVRLATVLAFTGLSVPLMGQAARDSYLPAQPAMLTVAGSGKMGTADGPVSSASFMQLGGIAVGKDGTIYVTDLAAHTIRAIRNGIVTTIAGTSDPGRIAMQRTGGFLDGPALQARFNRPSGIVSGADGSLYIADERNKLIRRLKNGLVSTFAGSMTKPAGDGKENAGFSEPRGIALDDAGDLYVADFNKGLRKVTLNGTVSTLTYPNDAGVSSVAARGHGSCPAEWCMTDSRRGLCS